MIATLLQVICNTCERNTLSRLRESRATMIDRLSRDGWTFAPTHNDPDGYVQCPQCVRHTVDMLAASQPGATQPKQETET